MEVVNFPLLQECWEKHSIAEQPLKLWLSRVRNEKWSSLNEIKTKFPADILGRNRVVFKIKGNSFRLIAVVYPSVGKIYVKFVDTHAEYDKIDALTV